MFVKLLFSVETASFVNKTERDENASDTEQIKFD